MPASRRSIGRRAWRRRRRLSEISALASTSIRVIDSGAVWLRSRRSFAGRSGSRSPRGRLLREREDEDRASVRRMADAASRGRARSRELPPPLPPETRTVGQLVAEATRFYGNRFWPSVALGIPPALLIVAGAPLPERERVLVVLVAAPLLLTVSYVRACVLVLPERRGSLAVAFAAGALVFAPVPLLLAISALLVLPALGWLALFGLVVPVVLAEGLGFRGSFRRAAELARADYVHALGGLSTLAIVAFLSQAVLFFLLR